MNPDRQQLAALGADPQLRDALAEIARLRAEVARLRSACPGCSGGLLDAVCSSCRSAIVATVREMDAEDR